MNISLHDKEMLYQLETTSSYLAPRLAVSLIYALIPARTVINSSPYQVCLPRYDHLYVNSSR